MQDGQGGALGAMAFSTFSVAVPLQPTLPLEPHQDLLSDPAMNHLPRSGSMYRTELEEIK